MLQIYLVPGIVPYTSVFVGMICPVLMGSPTISTDAKWLFPKDVTRS